MQTFKNNIVVNGIYLAFIDGQRCVVLSHFYEEIAKALNFPDYFVPNFDSLDECINDLSWIEENEIRLLIFNYDDLLFEEKFNLDVINNIFANAMSELEAHGKHFSVLTQKTS
ncbi:MAG: barstar family protein [Chitinophagales bacterium]|jgi:RNAse (barnase) inhibitor barstar|nr:barstar family protein [Chitinophagales bacterium]HQW68182.1 barstar family protein [Flavobacterium sp.]MBP6154930.1 barstar family protein [Chitinophagales bacterium]HQV78943.1 barstar family protein [Chitinophagales bacterium]HQW68225.1 barstar family protein [Flavobacterium sp.]